MKTSRLEEQSVSQARPRRATVIPDRIDLIDIEHLIPSTRNARTHSERQISELAGSIQAFGFMVPVLVDRQGTIIAGHARVLAAHQLALERVPVIVVNHLNESEKRAYALADNKIAMNADWDQKLLRVELEALKDEGVSLAVVGFTESEFNALIDKLDSQIRKEDEDSIADTVGDVVSRLGDVWTLGDHKLLCGDAIESQSYLDLLGNQSAQMAFTDPPYNVAYRAAGSGATITNDNQGAGFGAFLDATCENLLKYTAGALYVCMSSSELHALHAAFTKAGGHWSTFIIWGKSTFTLGRSDYHRQYEPILYGWRKAESHYWCGARDQGDLWLFDKQHANDLHPTMKPVALVERAILNSSSRGDAVLDPFAGSGSTLIACEKTGRRARVMEIEPHYCDVIVNRWQEFTGREASLQGSGTTFGQVKSDGKSSEQVVATNDSSIERIV